MGFNDCFKEYYRNWVSGLHIKRLVEFEENLSAFIDSDLFEGFILNDEVLILYELIRDECVKRCTITARQTT